MRQFAFILIIGALMFYLCEPKCKAVDYYPLNEEIQLQYELTVSTSSTKQTSDLFTRRSLPERTIGGKKAIPIVWTFGTTSTMSFFVKDDSGLYQVGVQEPKDVDPKIFDPPIYFIRYPIQVGANWQSHYETTYWKPRFNLILKNTIDKIDDIVTTAAGTFDKCIRVKGTFTGTETNTLFNPSKPDDYIHDIYVTIELYNWYAPNVGWVKGIKKETYKGQKGDYVLDSYGETVYMLKSISK